MKRTGSTNIELVELINEIRKISSKNKSNFWKRIILDLSKSSRQRRVANLFKINKFSNDNETIIVPGKVLGTGILNKKVTVAAFNFSESAIEKIKKSGSEALSINELLKKNPKGNDVRIIG